MVLYKYMTLTYLEDSIKNHRLYLSDGSNFNDPFDCHIFDKSTNGMILVNKLRILCLTNSHTKKMMWSHYADSHKGVCLAINVPDHLVFPVCYTSKRLYTDTDIDKILSETKLRKKNARSPMIISCHDKKYAYVKDKKWRDENEYRIVFCDNEPGLIHENANCFMSVKIKRIYLGVNFDYNENKKILFMCNERRIEIAKIQLSKENYGLRV